MKRILFILLLSIVITSFDLPKSAWKKVDKTITALWPEGNVQREVINISSDQKESLSFNLEDNKLFKLTDSTQLVGYLFLAEAPSKADKFDYMVIFKPDLSILTVQLLVYREDQGGEIGSKRWLKQFNGKSGGKEMKFGYDIQNISGATISARSMTKGIEVLSKNIQELKNKKII